MNFMNIMNFVSRCLRLARIVRGLSSKFTVDAIHAPGAVNAGLDTHLTKSRGISTHGIGKPFWTARPVFVPFMIRLVLGQYLQQPFDGATVPIATIHIIHHRRRYG